MRDWGKVFRLLNLVVEHPGVYGVRNLAREVDLPKSTVQRIVTGWRDAGIVSIDENQKLVAGLALIRLAAEVIRRMPLRTLARPHLQALTERFNESAYLFFFDRIRRVILVVDRVDCSHHLRYIVEIGETLSPAYGAVGKAILAHLPDDEVNSLIAEANLVSLTPRSITDPEELRAQVHRARERGYGFSYGERVTDIAAIAVAILDNEGLPIGAVAVSIPTSRFDPNAEGELAAAVREAARAITYALGGSVT